jgi:hypothetical protein
MWLYPVVALLVILCAVGAGIVGGVYMFFLIPLAVILLIGAVIVALYNRALEGSADAPTDTKPRGLPRRHMRSPGHVPTSPGQLIDQRRAQQ